MHPWAAGLQALLAAACARRHVAHRTHVLASQHHGELSLFDGSLPQVRPAATAGQHLRSVNHSAAMMASRATSRFEEPTMQNLEQQIRIRAHQMWVEDGRREGEAGRYWLAAEREIMAAFARSTPATASRSAGNRPTGARSSAKA